MPRSISVVRRRVGVVDLTVRLRANVTGFRFSAASNFDGAFTAFQTVPNAGLRSASITDAQAGRSIGSQFRDECRFVFNPSDYTSGVAAVRDDTPWFIRLEPRNPDGSFGTAEAMHMIMPYSSGPKRAVMLSGTVPAGADLSASLEIQLPMQCNDWIIRNTGGALMYVAFERGAVAGPEFALEPAPTSFLDYGRVYTVVTQLFIRGNGGTTTMTSTFSERGEQTV